MSIRLSFDQWPTYNERIVEIVREVVREIDRCLDQWTPEMMEERFSRDMRGHLQWHTRTSVLQRMFSHDAYRCGEPSQTLGIENLPQIDQWATRR